MTPRALVLAGPTASGKRALALALAEHIALEIVSVDSAQVYRGMDIGTAKPSPAERAQVPHHLIDILDPAERYSAARFASDATRLIGEINQRGRVALQPGLGFGAAQGAGFARLNVGTTGELVEEAVRRMAAALTP